MGWILAIVALVLLTTAVAEGHADTTHSVSASSSLLRGHVIDKATGQPIADATIAVWEIRTYRERWRTRTTTTLQAVTKTENNGSYELRVEGGFYCNVYAYYDDPRSPGCDYIPQLHSFTLETGDEVTLLFEMVPAASILFEGDLLFVDSSRPPESVGFTVIPVEPGSECDECILTYGTTATSHSQFINVSHTQVIIPVHTVIQIKVAASHTLLIDEPQVSQLETGDELRIQVDKYALPYNLNLTRDFIQLTETQVNETEQLGFYVIAEKRDLDQTSTLLKNAEAEFLEGRYVECYADLREAYTKAAYISETVQAMYVNASASTPILILFLALTSTSLAYLLCEPWAQRLLATGGLYVLLLLILVHVYTGCQIVATPFLLLTAVLSILASFLFTFIVPRLLPMTTTTFFSMAKRNLKGRRTHFVLTLITVTMLVMSFVALTSFSVEHGFTTTAISTTPPEAEGLLVRKPLPDVELTVETQVAITFDPLDASDIEWLQKKPEVTLVVPKAENYPTRSRLGVLSTARQRLSIFSVLGISPRGESEVTGMNQLLVEGQGRFLDDGEEDAIMISVRAAKALKAQVGERLTLSIWGTSIEATLVGLLDDGGLSRVRDLDGDPLIPEKVIPVIVDGEVIDTVVVPCEPSEVVVMDWQTAMKFSFHVFLSRIDLRVETAVEALAFARWIALERDYWAWSSEEEHVTRVGIMPYLETKGAFIFIPWLIVILNVVITMINAIYERRREMVILSSVGLNPAHITFLFVAEALIIGIIGGGMGYLLGLSLYRLMPLISSGIVVRQKISAGWCLASLSIAMAAVLVGALVALQSSVDITPSARRRWQMGRPPQKGSAWVFDIPFKVQEDEVDSLFEYVVARYKRYLYVKGIDVQRGRIQVKEEEETPEGSSRILHFQYLLGNQADVGSLPFQLVAKKGEHEDAYAFDVTCKGTEEIVRKTVSFLRMAVIEWSSNQERS